MGEYINSTTKIKCRCKNGHIWESKPNDLLNGYGCAKCSGNAKLTHEEFLEKFYIKNKNAKNIEILEKYKGNAIKIKCRCLKDDYIWSATPNALLNGTSCPKCSGNIKNKTTEYFKQEMKDINSDIEILGEYKGALMKIKVKCLKDGYIWNTIPSVLLRGGGCPKCGNNARRNTEQFIQEMKEINNDIEVIGEYVNNRSKIKCRCRLDGYEWEVRPNDLLHGSGCPKCNESKGEKRIAKYLDNRSINYIHDKPYFKDLRSNKNGILKPDFIIENMKIWIEFDGEQHFRPVDFAGKGKELAKEQFRINQENDKLKNEYAKEHNWKLIRIPYWDFDRIEEILNKELN